MTIRLPLTIMFLILSAAGCGGDDECGEAELEVKAYDDQAELVSTECAPIPAECGEAVDCDAEECRTALFDLCIEAGVGGDFAFACHENDSPPVMECHPGSEDFAPVR